MHHPPSVRTIDARLPPSRRAVLLQQGVAGTPEDQAPEAEQSISPHGPKASKKRSTSEDSSPVPYFESELGYEHFGMLQQAGMNVEKNEIVGFKAPGVELTVDFVGNTYPCAIGAWHAGIRYVDEYGKKVSK